MVTNRSWNSVPHLHNEDLFFSWFGYAFFCLSIHGVESQSLLKCLEEYMTVCLLPERLLSNNHTVLILTQ